MAAFTEKDKLDISIDILRKPFHQRNQADLELLVQCLEGCQFFVALREKKESLPLQVCRVLRYKSATAGSLIMRQGSVGEDFWIVLKGVVRIYRTYRKSLNGDYLLDDNDESEAYVAKSEELNVLSDGSSFGERALITKGKRTANVEALTDGHFAVLEKFAFDKILNHLKSQERLMQGEEFIGMNLFRSFPIEYVLDLFDISCLKKTCLNQLIYQQGAPDLDYVYFIRSGEFKVSSLTYLI